MGVLWDAWRVIEHKKQKNHPKPQWFNGSIHPEHTGWYIVVIQDNGGEWNVSPEYFDKGVWKFDYREKKDDLDDSIIAWSSIPTSEDNFEMRSE